MRLSITDVAGWLCAGAVCAAAAMPVHAGIPGGSVGYPDLIERLGIRNIPTGANVRVGQVEAPVGGNYSPNQGAAAEYSGKTFYEMSGPTGTSTHANTVAKNFYGNATSIAPGITDIHLYEVVHWLEAGFLRYTSSSTTPPLAPPDGLRIFNNSWSGTSANLSIVRRADYATTEFNVLLVNGVNNDPSAGANWPLMAAMYNGLCVGKLAGGHQMGDTLVDGAGRMKPEIVAPGQLTSYATGTVSAAAALMIETAINGVAGGSPLVASRSEVIKAVLLAGARHRPAWSNNPATSGPNRGVTARPLDEEMGVDIVNVNNSHIIMTGGQYAGMSSPPDFTTAASAGWALESVGLSDSAYWRFSVPETADEVSIAVTWHRLVPIGFGAGNVANFDVELWRVDESNQLATLVGDPGLPYFSAGNVVSNSAVDNIEHLYIRNLQPGAYVLEVKRVDALNSFATWDVAVAWRMPAPPCVGDFVTSKTFQPPPDGIVDGADLGALLAQWGPTAGSFADIVTSATFEPPPDGIVDGADLAVLLAHWGPCN